MGNRNAYIIRRVLLLIPTLFAIYTLTFLLMHATPGGPWDSGEKPLPAEVVAQLNKAYGLDKPLWRQYVDYLGKAVHGDFGPSFTHRSRSVTDIVKGALPISLKLGFSAMIIAILVGIPLGIIGAIKHNTWMDYLATATSIIGISTPPYVVASLLVLVFASRLHLVPTQGWSGIWSAKAIIPAVALALYPAAVLARYMRASMLEVLGMDYIRTARAKGLREVRVITQHAMRNSFLPVLTVGGIVMADVLTGSFFVEVVYSVPGIGRYFVQSISGRDYPVILGIVLLLGFIISVMNMLVDLLYPLLDPRIET
ncbi:MAG: ABC transporter permease [Nitrolancea sp.]